MVMLPVVSPQQVCKRYRTFRFDGAIGRSQAGEHAEAVQGKLRHGDSQRATLMHKDDLSVMQPKGGIPLHQPKGDLAV